MSQARRLQGRWIGEEEIRSIRGLIQEHPQAHRTRLSQLLCEAWNWRNDRGELKDMAARSLLLKLQEAGEVLLPPPRRPATNAQRGRKVEPVSDPGQRIGGALADLQPIRLEIILPRDEHHSFFWSLLAHYHYLGYRGPAGENLQYLAWSAAGEPLGCLVFDAAAWKVRARDCFIGWDSLTRQAHLRRITNNSRFLILPWIGVPHLASHLLSLASARLREDWRGKYRHAVELVETFVERERFAGVCYRAANWIHLGTTRGRSRKDRHFTLRVPVKDVYVRPLHSKFRRHLGVADG
jgi:hypothetical protein